MAFKSSNMDKRLSGDHVRKRPSQDRIDPYKGIIPTDREIRVLRKKCRKISRSWATEVGILYGYTGKKKSIYEMVTFGFNRAITAVHTARVMAVAQWYVDNQQQAVRKIRKMLKDHPDWYQF